MNSRSTSRDASSSSVRSVGYNPWWNTTHHWDLNGTLCILNAYVCGIVYSAKRPLCYISQMACQWSCWSWPVAWVAWTEWEQLVKWWVSERHHLICVFVDHVFWTCTHKKSSVMCAFTQCASQLTLNECTIVTRPRFWMRYVVSSCPLLVVIGIGPYPHPYHHVPAGI